MALVEIRNMGILRSACDIPSEWIFNWNAIHGVAHDTGNTLSRHLVCDSFIAPRVGIDMELQEAM